MYYLEVNSQNIIWRYMSDLSYFFRLIKDTTISHQILSQVIVKLYALEKQWGIMSTFLDGDAK